jgi:UDP-3-O-[3-hydroxymyristoyl] N-acetylglucosamine deacetylase
MPYIGKYESFAGSHHLNHLLTKEILSSTENYQIKELASDTDTTFSKVYA